MCVVRGGVSNSSNITAIIPPVVDVSSGDGDALMQDVNGGGTSLTEGFVDAIREIPAVAVTEVKSAVGAVVAEGPGKVALQFVVVLGVCALVFEAVVMFLVRDEL